MKVVIEVVLVWRYPLEAPAQAFLECLDLRYGRP